MKEELLPLLEDLIRKEAVGTLVLGKGKRARRLFFTGHEVHLMDAGKACRFVPSSAFFDNDRVSEAVFEEVLTELRYTPQSVRSLLDQRGLLTPGQREELVRLELIEEMLLIIDRNTHFAFGEGNVPEELLLPSSQTIGVPMATFADSLRVRDVEQKEVLTTLPSREEVLILSEDGAREVGGDGRWIFRQVATLIDGSRTVREIVSESIYFPHLTMQVLSAAARQGWVKKTLFPELRDLDAFQYPPYQAEEMLRGIEESIEMASDPIEIRKILAAFYLRAGQVDKAVLQYHTIGDTYRVRDDGDRALACYREAMRWNPGSESLRDAVVEYYLEAADRAQHNRDPEAERRYLGEALRYRRDDLELYIRALDTYEGNEAQILKTLPKFVQVLNRDPRRDLALRFFARLREQYPNSIGVRKKHINLLLDREMKDEAVEELQFLAGTLLDAGRKKEAASIYSAITRLDPTQSRGGREVRRLLDKKPSVWSRLHPSPALILFLVILVPVTFHHAYAYALFSDLAERSRPLMTEPCPPVGSVEFRHYRNRLEDTLHDYDSFGRMHFLTAWGLLSHRVADDLQDRVGLMDGQLESLRSRLWNRAEESYLRGRLKEASEAYAEIAERWQGTPLALESLGKVKEIETYQAEAIELNDRANLAYENGAYQEAFVLKRQLIENYPRSPQAHSATLPLQIESQPEGAEVYLKDTRLGTTPLLLKVHPTRPLYLEVRHEGYESSHFVVKEPTSSRVQINLYKKW